MILFVRVLLFHHRAAYTLFIVRGKHTGLKVTRVPFLSEMRCSLHTSSGTSFDVS